MPDTVEPFEDIALALSGGGFRAASFSLGVLSYLNRVFYKNESLLSHVRFISSASGGSITNLFYVLRASRNEEFSTIFHELRDALEGERLIGEAFSILRKSEQWEQRPQKGRNLINAFSLAYDSPLLFNQETFSSILEGTHVEEICVNATDFDNGITFRFQNTGLIGNKYLHFNTSRESRAVAGKLKLADVLAASSCFPSGFEPIIFPKDFLHPQLNDYAVRSCFEERPSDRYVKDAEAEKNPEATKWSGQQIGLMDGGITDNQGITSFLLANNRRKTKKVNGKEGFDLFIASDVASHYMEAYALPEEDKKVWWGKPKLQQWINVLKFSWLGVLVGAAAFYFEYTGIGYVVTTVATLFTFVYLLGLRYFINAREAALTEGSTWGITLFKYIDTFFRVRTSAIAQMLTARLKSVGILAGDVYLKQIRRLTFQLLFQDEKWAVHTAPVFIYELSSINRINRNAHQSDFDTMKMAGVDGRFHMAPSDSMEQCANEAQKMDTTLWFDKNHLKTRDKIIATGQFTTCYALIQYVCRLEKKEAMNDDLKELQSRLLADWSDFKKMNFGEGFIVRSDVLERKW